MLADLTFPNEKKVKKKKIELDMILDVHSVTSLLLGHDYLRLMQ